MFRDRVVGHYTGRGYRVDADPVVTGDSGSEYRLGLMAVDDIGRLALWWGDQEPFEGPELESLKRAARDLGAAPAIAVPQATNTLRDHARRHGVVVVDESMLDAARAASGTPLPPRSRSSDDPTKSKEIPPWPDPDRTPAPRATTPTPVKAPWKDETSTAAPPSSAPDAGSTTRKPFGWLGDDQTTATTPAPSGANVPRRRTTDIMPRFWAPVLLTAVGLLVLIIVLALVL